MVDLKGKKLLVLGGTVSTYDVVRRAKERGVYVIVTDYLPTGVSKEIADETAMISTSDYEALENLIEEKKIDGVFTGASETNIVFAQQLCKRVNLPFYATEEQFAVTMNKRRFKEVCTRCDIPVSMEFTVKSSTDLQQIEEFPVIVKPVDGCSSKGISICYNEKELKIAYDAAQKSSSIGDVLIEKYIEGYDDVCMYYTIQNGNLTLSAMTDRDVNSNQKGKAPQPNALFFPSKYIDVYMNVLHEKIKKLAEELQLQNGTMFVQAFVKNKEFIVFEMGYRLCGANEYIIVSKENGINTLDMYLNMALTGRFEGWNNEELDNPYFKNKYCILIPLLRQGTIQTCDCINKIRTLKEVIHIQQFYNDYETVPETAIGTLNQSLARIYICEKNDEKLNEAIKKVQSLLDIKDVNGNDMLLPGLKIKG